jgi:hypothetical protein
MQIYAKKFFILTILLTLFVIPNISLVLAQPAPEPNPTDGLVPCGKGSAGPEDCTFDSLLALVNNVLSFAFWLASIVAAGVIIYAGGKMIYYGATNPGQAASAKKMLWNVIIGYFIVIIAWLLVKGLVDFFARDSGPLNEAIIRVFGSR